MCGVGVPPTDATSSGSDSPTRLRRCPRVPHLRHRPPSHHQLSRAWRGSRGTRRPSAAVLSPLVIPLIKQYRLTVVNVPRALRCGREPCYLTTVEPTKVSLGRNTPTPPNWVGIQKIPSFLHWAGIPTPPHHWAGFPHPTQLGRNT
jgi:hypothetical protein